MRRGTTPILKIITDRDLTKGQMVVLTVEDRAGTEVSVDNDSGRMEISSDAVLVRLTQAETLKLMKGPIKLQLRAVDGAGNATASNIMSGQLDDVLKEGEIGV